MSSADDEGRSVPWRRPVLAGAVADLAAGTLFGWSLVAQPAADELGMSRGVAAAVFASAIVVCAVVLLVLPPVQRRAGPRRLLHVAAVAGGGGLLLAATAQHAVVLLLGVGLLFGAANGLAYGVAVRLAARAPVSRRGTATGLVVGAYAAGPVLLGLVAPSALDAVGWRSCLAFLAGAVAVLLTVAGALAPGETPAGKRSTPNRVPPRDVVLLWIVFAGGAAPGLVLFAHAVTVADDRRLSAQVAGLAVSALAAGNLAGRLTAGVWSDRIGRLPALGVALTTGAASVAAVSAASSSPSLVLAGFLGTGLAYGAVSALVPAATADLVGAAAFSRAYSVVFTGWGCAGLLAPVAGGRLIGLADRTPALLGLVAAPLLAAAVAVALLTRRARAPSPS